jgi:hypothetical protein
VETVMNLWISQTAGMVLSMHNWWPIEKCAAKRSYLVIQPVIGMRNYGMYSQMRAKFINATSKVDISFRNNIYEFYFRSKFAVFLWSVLSEM